MVEEHYPADMAFLLYEIDKLGTRDKRYLKACQLPRPSCAQTIANEAVPAARFVIEAGDVGLLSGISGIAKLDAHLLEPADGRIDAFDKLPDQLRVRLAAAYVQDGRDEIVDVAVAFRPYETEAPGTAIEA